LARKRIRVEKQDIDTPDKFLTISHRVWDKVAEHRKPLLIAAIAILVVVGVALTISHFLQSTTAESTRLLADGLEAEGAMVAAGKDQAVLTRKGIPAFPSIASRAEAAMEGFDKFLKKEKSSDIGYIGLLGKAKAMADLGKHREAVDLFREALKSEHVDPYLRAMTVDGLAYSLETLGQSDEAIRELESAVSQSQGYTKDLLEYHLGRLYESKGDKTKARGLYVGVFERLNSEKLSPGEAMFLKSQLTSQIMDVDPTYEISQPARSIQDLEGQIPPDVMKKLQQALQKKNAAKSKGPAATPPAQEEKAPAGGEDKAPAEEEKEPSE